MSVIERNDLITDQAFNWPKEYALELEKVVTKSKALGTGTTKKNMTELVKVQNQLNVATERSSKEFIDQKAALNSLNTTTRNAVKDVQNLDNAYDKLSKELNDTRKSYKNLAASGRENTKEAKAQLNQIRRLDGQLKKIDSSVGQNQRSVGKYSNALKGMTARFIGWGAAIALVTKALMSGFRAVRDNSKANAELRGILNKTRKETIELRKEQLRLGGATVFTATQVTKAQTELSRLGLSMEEIIALTPSILDGAIALGVDMAEAAELVAGQLNAFGLAAQDGQRVTDVLVRSTQISAFNFIKLKDALKVVSPAAAAVGDNIEDVVSKLTAAVDANIDASTASTALRNIYIELAKSGLSWDEAMIKINTSTNKLSTANDLFGKRGAVVALALADNTTKINENKIALDNATGSAEAFAKAQRDNLSGDQLLWTSAWEGFFQQLNEGNSLISQFTRGTIQAFTAAMQGITRAMAGTDLETVLWEENLVKADLSLEALGRIANNSADEISKLKTAMAEGGFAEAAHASANLSDAEKRRVFILDLLKKKLTEVIPLVVEKTEATEEDTVAVEENVKALKKLESLVAELPGEFTDFQLGLFAITDKLFGKNTIDQDAEKFLKKTGETISKVGELSKAAREKDIEEAELVAALKAEIINKSFDLAVETSNRLADLRIQRISDELTALEFARDRALEKEGQSERAKFEINKKFDNERRELQRKQALTEKANALFKIGLNLAIAISSGNVFKAIAAGAQAAVVVATPIPQFAEGTDSTPKDYIAGEGKKKGGGFMPELRKSKGKWSLVDQPTMFKNSPGDQIVSGKETDSILGNLSDLTGQNLLTNKGNILSLLNSDIKREPKKDNGLEYVLREVNNDLIRTIKNKKELNVAINTGRPRIQEKDGTTYIDRIDKYYRR